MLTSVVTPRAGLQTHVYARSMYLGGLPVPDRLVLDLVRSLRAHGIDGTADTLEEAYRAGRSVVVLSSVDREAILRAFRDCPYGRAELRTVLLLRHEWQATAGLVGHVVPVA